MKNWIKVVAGFQDAESAVQKLMPHGADDELSGLARERQAILEWLTPVGLVPGTMPAWRGLGARRHG